jgi:hypothetical protein
MTVKLQVQDQDGSWRTVLSGDHAEWLQEQVTNGYRTPVTMKYRCFDEVIHGE